MSKEKCQGKDRNGDRCRNYPAEGMTFCKRAHLYMADYTPEQLANLRFCKGCNKWKDMPADKGQCVECSNRGYENRKKARAAVVLCKASDCTFKKSDDNDYCGKHQIYVFVDECKAEGVRPCRRYLHGCREKLAKNYTFSSCVACLELERKQDKERRENVDPSNVVRNETNEELKQCTVCRAWKPLSDYTNRNNSNITLTCLNCRDNNAIANANRDVEHRREQERIASQKPERKATKKAWEEANPEKVALKTLNYRDKQHSNNQEEYLRRNAENMKKWRENNPEKVKEANESNIKNIKYAYQSYIHKCQTHKTNFELTYEQFAEMVIMPCYYCNIIQDKGFNGIDRMDSMQGYILNNCVSCCIVCNRLKGAVDNDTFIKRVEHILTYNNIINGKLYPNAFANTINVSYSRYIDSAMQRDYAFELTEELFNEIIKNNCYICGKSNSSKHYNGIDRYDNNIGYTPDNVRCCCGQCNIMKKDLEYTYFINKLTNIHNNCKSKNITTCATPINNSLSRNVNKPSAEERKQNAKERKQRSRDAKRAQCGNAEYLKQRAEQMAKYRKNKKEKQNQTDKDNV